MTLRLIKEGETVAARRRVYFDPKDVTDFNTPELSEANGQPQISVNGAAWTNTGIGVLSAVGNGAYYADLAEGTGESGDFIRTRYKSANTAETRGSDVLIINIDPADLAAAVTVVFSGEAASASTIQFSDPIEWDGAGGVEINFSLEGLDSTGWDTFVFTVKRKAVDDEDAQAVLTVRVTDPADPEDGTIVWRGKESANDPVAALAVTAEAPDTELTLTLSSGAADLPPVLEPGQEYDYEIVRWIGGDKRYVARGQLTVTRSVFRGYSPPGY